MRISTFSDDLLLVFDNKMSDFDHLNVVYGEEVGIFNFKNWTYFEVFGHGIEISRSSSVSPQSILPDLMRIWSEMIGAV